MSFLKNKFVAAFVAVTVGALGYAFLSRADKNFISDFANTVFVPIQGAVSRAVQPIDDFFTLLHEMKAYKAENDRLIAEITSLKREARSVDAYKTENERLKKLLGIKQELESCETTAARVVGVDAENWFETITLDKGSRDGLEISDAVITADGVVGQITDIGSNWARVSTILNPESALGIRVVRTGEIGVAAGDSKLRKSKSCKLSYLADNTTVVAGDILESSGYGGIYPPGLMLGKITEAKRDTIGRVEYAVVAPFVDFSDLHEVLVVTEWSMSSEYGFEDDTAAPASERSADNAVG